MSPSVLWEEFSPITTDTGYYTQMRRPLVRLGKLLFFDPKLSGSNQISCSSCHNPEMGWTTHTEKALGHDHLLGRRNAQSLLNVGSRKVFFWDGRAGSLEEQAREPIEAHNEMNIDLAKLPQKLARFKTYTKLFAQAFDSSEITENQILVALAAFQRTIKSQESRFDKFLKGNHQALNQQEIRGLHLFRTKAACMNCHHGKFLTDGKFHNIGLTYYKRTHEDLGRYYVTQKAEDVGKFLTPSLRDLLNTRPWMHNGFFDDLEGIISIYNSGMQMLNPSAEQKAADPLFPSVDSLMQPLKLTSEEIEDLAAFLKSLNGTKFKMKRPEIPRKK